MRLGEAGVPDGLRIYAVGDVHGCDHLLSVVHDEIAGDLAARPIGRHRIIHLGDYVDRGPASAAVVERLSRLAAEDDRILCLRGNHEEMLLAFLADPAETGLVFLANGGLATLSSYGVTADLDYVSRDDLLGFAEALVARQPAHHRAFLDGLAYSLHFGDFFFCHAGVRPGVPLEAQDPIDLTWIREGFLDSNADFGAVVIHGHTPAREPEILTNRINIDTGAVFSGDLTCLVLEGNDYRFL